jgi:hypothetical protein
MIPIHEDGKQKGKINQTILQTGKPRGTYGLGDKHPNKKYEGVFYIKWYSKPKKLGNHEHWGTIDRVERTRELEKLSRQRLKKDPARHTLKKQTDKKYREKNKDKLKQYFKARYQNNKDKIRKERARYRDENRDKIREANRLFRESNRERLREYHKELYHSRKEDVDYIIRRKQHALKLRQQPEHKEKSREYQRANRTRINKRMREYYKDPNKKLRRTISTRILQAVKHGFTEGTKVASSMQLVGCTIDELRDHLESQFTDGMTWDNMGRGGWHIDHIIPCSFFDLTKPSHQKLCFNYQNLQPLWEKDNIIKADNIHWSIVLTLMINNYKTIGLN